MESDKFEKLIKDLKERVARKQQRAAEKYFNTLDTQEWVEGGSAVSALR